MMKRILTAVIVSILFSQVAYSGSITGTITSPSGTPVANAQVTCHGFEYSLHGTYSDTNGDYTITGIIPNQTCKISAFAPAGTDYMLTYVERFIEAGNISGVDIQFNSGGLTISGTVTDKATGLPLENIPLQSHIDESDIWGGGGLTDENGYYEIIGLPPATIRVRAYSDNHAQFGYEIELTGNYTQNFALPLPSSLSGIVIDMHTGQPMANVPVDAWNEMYYSSSSDTTDAGGRFRLDNLAPGISEVSAQPEVSTGYLRSMSWPSDRVLIPEAADIDNRFIAIQKGVPVTGRFIRPDGTPIAYIEFEFQSEWAQGKLHSGANGEFEIALAADDEYLALGFEEYDDNYSKHYQALNIPDSSTLVDLGDVIMYSVSDGGQISGTVTNPSGAACEGDFAVVALKTGTSLNADNLMSFRPTRETMPDGSGAYTLKALGPGNYDIWLITITETSQGSETIITRDSVLNVPVSANGVDLQYLSKGGTITGSVENIDGDILAGVMVLLNDTSTGIFGCFTEVKSDGTFTANNIEPGNYNLAIVHKMYGRMNLQVTVNEGEVTPVGTITVDFAGVQQGPDLDGDGLVGVDDLYSFAEQWIAAGSGGDLDGDGTVGLADFSVLGQMWMMQAVWRY